MCTDGPAHLDGVEEVEMAEGSEVNRERVRGREIHVATSGSVYVYISFFARGTVFYNLGDQL